MLLSGKGGHFVDAEHLLSSSPSFLELYFFSQFPGNFFAYNKILISMKKDAHTSCL